MMRRLRWTSWIVLVVAAVAVGGPGCGPRGGASAKPVPADDAAAESRPGEQDDDERIPPESDPETDPGDDSDGDGVPDGVDQCPGLAMAMSAGCTKEMMRGCPDDCRPPTIVVP